MRARGMGAGYASSVHIHCQRWQPWLGPGPSACTGVLLAQLDPPCTMPRHSCNAPRVVPPLQNHNNEDIYEKAVAILESYFDVEDGEEENLAPAVEGGEHASHPEHTPEHTPEHRPEHRPAHIVCA